jgi:AraC family L-rhamnose operon regulatory protein RhaS
MAKQQEPLDNRQDSCAASPAAGVEPAAGAAGPAAIFYPEYRPPFAVQCLQGAVRYASCRDRPALLFLRSAVLGGQGGRAIVQPLIGALGPDGFAATGADGWLVEFHPAIINQEFAAWPAFPATVPADALLQGDLALLQAALTGQSAVSIDGARRLNDEEAVFLNRLFSIMHRLLAARDDAFWPCRSRSLFLEVLYFLRQAPEPVPQPSRSRQVHDWLHVHYGEKITLDRLSRQFATNRTSLQEQFRAEYGSSVMDRLGEIRVEMAGILMRNTELSLAEICHRVGFADYSNFFREFRKRRGIPPGDFRACVATVRIY